MSDWLERTLKGVSAENAVAAFEQAFARVWARARVTLGDVTLGAIGDRVIYTAAERFPMLECLSLVANGLDCTGLRRQAAPENAEELRQAMRFVLVEFLSVLGDLTAEVLTPALHAALSNAASVQGGVPGAEDKVNRGAKS